MTKTAFIAISGRPNVGKSTLMNAILGEKIAIVSSKPQTTRNRITGILTEGEEQFVFLDTPGVHKARTRLGGYMNKSARQTVASADAVILIAEAGRSPGDIELSVINQIKKNSLPSMLVLNKIDLCNREALAESIAAYAAVHSFDAVVPASAVNSKNVSVVIEEARQFLHEGPFMFDEDVITDQPERKIAAEIIREKLLRVLSEEIPHGTAVMIEQFEETPELLRIRAEIYCEKNSHKGIIVGRGGQTLKKIGTYAREDMEAFFGVKVFLDLWVKVKENWRDSDVSLNNFGFNPKEI